ncbi:MAG: N-acetylmuramoyl-L-alanine amidase [Clostridiales bacterium]|nr:N-acetylmuramoyl-L-alanine amidase [Clostridiales bacterium]
MGNKRQGGRGVTSSRRRRQKQLAGRVIAVLAMGVICLTGIIFLGRKLFFSGEREAITAENLSEMMKNGEEEWVGAPELDVQLLDVNEYSRPGTALKEIKGIVIHYIGNPGTSAQANRDYFQGLKDAHLTKASSHFIVGLEGEIIQCVPSTEISYASNERNKDTLSIECCHPDETGKFNESTYESMVSLTGWLCDRFGLTSEDVIRHHDVTGKICPKYFVENEDAWAQFKADVNARITEIQEMKKER